MAKASLQKAFGEILRSFRLDANFTQEELAHKSGLHRTYVSQLERGLKSPSLVAIQSLAQALGVRGHVLIKAVEDRIRER